MPNAARREPASGAVHWAAARALLLDFRAAHACEFLQDRGIPALLLKGPTIAGWLYRDGTLRPYRDIDILVAPADWSRASIALAEIGFRRWLAGAHRSEHIENEQEWSRRWDWEDRA